MEDFPQEIIMNICFYLPHKEKLKVQYINKTWWYSLQMQYYWRTVYQTIKMKNNSFAEEFFSNLLLEEVNLQSDGIVDVEEMEKIKFWKKKVFELLRNHLILLDDTNKRHTKGPSRGSYHVSSYNSLHSERGNKLRLNLGQMEFEGISVQKVYPAVATTKNGFSNCASIIQFKINSLFPGEKERERRKIHGSNSSTRSSGWGGGDGLMAQLMRRAAQRRKPHPNPMMEEMARRRGATQQRKGGSKNPMAKAMKSRRQGIERKEYDSESEIFNFEFGVFVCPKLRVKGFKRDLSVSSLGCGIGFQCKGSPSKKKKKEPETEKKKQEMEESENENADDFVNCFQLNYFNLFRDIQTERYHANVSKKKHSNSRNARFWMKNKSCSSLHKTRVNLIENHENLKICVDDLISIVCDVRTGLIAFFHNDMVIHYHRLDEDWEDFDKNRHNPYWNRHNKQSVCNFYLEKAALKGSDLELFPSVWFDSPMKIEYFGQMEVDEEIKSVEDAIKLYDLCVGEDEEETEEVNGECRW